MTKFDMGAAWDDAVQLLRSHSGLTGTIAAVFLFLPALAVAWFGPVPIEPPSGATVDQIMATFRENIRQMVPGSLIVALFTIAGTLAILRLWLSRAGTSVGEALSFALTLFPTLVVAHLLAGIMLALGFILLIVPGLYLVGRLALIAPAVADRRIRNPMAAIGESWRLTQGNAWSIFFFLFLVALVFGIASVILGSLVGLVGGTGAGIGRILSGLVEAGFGAVASFVSIAVSAAAYRQLAVRRSELFE